MANMFSKHSSAQFRRISRSGFISFWRNQAVSLAALFAMTITLFAIGALMVGSTFLDVFLGTIKDKVDVTVYFVEDAQGSDILTVKSSLEALPEVFSTEYVSRDVALAAFRERHKDDAVMLAALDEIGSNPLRASINIKARELSQYESVTKFLEGENAVVAPSGTSIIEKVNYRQNKLVIDRMNKLIDYSRRLGTALIFILSLMSVLVTFNTISLALYSARDEISVMKLVGAANNFVRGPFLVQGAMYGVISGLCAAALLYPITLWLGSISAAAFGGLNIFSYYLAHFGRILIVLLVSGVAIGILSSYLAIIRYLKV